MTAHTRCFFLAIFDFFLRYLSTGLNPSNYAAFLKAWTSREDLMPALKVKPINVPTIT
jgi:hypothetical protein